MIQKVKPESSYIFTGATQEGLHTSSYSTVALAPTH